MTLVRRSLIALGVLSVSFAAQATSNRVFISPSGNNASDCANPSTPCLTFFGAQAQVSPGGEIIAEATGGYGGLYITQPVTISGPPGVVMYTGVGVTINAPGAKVVLRGLTIDGGGVGGDGITVTSVDTLFVENCVVTNFTCCGGVPFGGSGIQLNFSSESSFNLFVKDSVFRGNRYGIAAGPQTTFGRISIDHCQFENNQIGVMVGGLGSTLVVATIRDSLASGNITAGFEAQADGEINLESCVAVNNGVGILSAGASAQTPEVPRVRVSNTTVTDNTTGILATDIGVVLSRRNNTVEGNGTDGTFNGSYSAK